MSVPDSREDPNLPPGTYVRILDHARDLEEGNPPYGQVGDSLPVGGLLKAQAGAAWAFTRPATLYASILPTFPLTPWRTSTGDPAWVHAIFECPNRPPGSDAPACVASGQKRP